MIFSEDLPTKTVFIETAKQRKKTNSLYFQNKRSGRNMKFSVTGAHSRLIEHSTNHNYNKTHYGQKVSTETFREEIEPVALENFEIEKGPKTNII